MHTPEEIYEHHAIGDLADEGDEFTAAVWSSADGFSPLMFWATGRTEHEALEVASEIAEEHWRETIKDPEDLDYQLEAMDGQVWEGRHGPFSGTEFGEAPEIEVINRRRDRRRRQNRWSQVGPKNWMPE